MTNTSSPFGGLGGGSQRDIFYYEKHSIHIIILTLSLCFCSN